MNTSTTAAMSLVERRPLPTPTRVKTFAQAMFTAKRVPPEVGRDGSQFAGSVTSGG